MTKFYKRMLLPLFLVLVGAAGAIAQSTVAGKIKDANDEPMAGVNVVVKGTITGTITNTSGDFSLTISQAPPFTISVSFVGYKTQELEITEANKSGLNIIIEEQTLLGQEVVIAASRVEETFIKSPVTIEKMDLLAIRQSTSPDFYDGLANMKGVQVNNGSLNFTAVNTRGFATIANTRFVQWVDGMDTQAPLLNFPTGTIMGLGELDAEGIELIPGAASALYGPNAFNGIMIMTSKSPFDYQGLSAQVKQGVTSSDAGGTHPLGQYSIRYAKAFNNKLAFKVNFSYMKATDWTANDYTTDRNQENTLVRTNPNTDYSKNPDFDGMNLYGDEINIPTGIPSMNTDPNHLGVIHRTGFKESALLDNRDAKTIKGDVALHYRINDKLEVIGAYRYGGGNSLYQGNAKYALRDFNQQFYKLELKGSNFFVRSYMSGTDAAKSYHMDALGAYVNEALNPTQRADGTGWAQDYVLAQQGYFNQPQYGNVPAGNPAAARAFADRNIFKPDGSLVDGVQDTINKIRSQYFQKNPGGARLYDNSRLWHTELYYNFNKIKWADIVVGGNYRQYSLFSNATIFDEAPTDANDPQRIKINQYGAYTQVSKTIIEKLKLTGSIRYDKSDNFDGHFTPRVSAVYSANQNHSIRASFQTGFRNPDTQAQFIYFNTGTSILLGGLNGKQYGVYGDGAWTQSSYQAYVASGGSVNATTGALSGGDQSKLVTANLQYVKPEQLSSFEIGYKGVIAQQLLLDLNYYYSSYTDFLGEQFVVGKNATTHQKQAIKAGQVWYPYTNSPYKLTSYGIGAGLTYNLPRNFVLTGNYNYTTFSGQENDDFQANFNTPKNRYSVGIGNRKLLKNLGFNVNYRYQDSFWWQSSYGVGTIHAYGVLDAQVSYKVAPIKSMIKIGGTNLGGGDYRTNIGAPFVGQQYYVSITFDEFLK